MKLHWPACGLPYPSVVVSSPPVSPEKNPPPPPYSRVIVWISRLRPRKRFLLVSKMTPVQATIRTPPRRWDEVLQQTISSRDSIAVRSLWRRDYWIRVASRVCKYVCAQCLWQSSRFCFRTVPLYRMGKLDGEKRGGEEGL